ncbi:MAG: hypothetical protein OXI41_14340 [Chloroflexota bacterium]|nr:hypothetical protein [Chloroflexota bacterium]MDE2895774.1 hypothetical protein [Chloroflexota bacterium]
MHQFNVYRSLVSTARTLLLVGVRTFASVRAFDIGGGRLTALAALAGLALLLQSTLSAGAQAPLAVQYAEVVDESPGRGKLTVIFNRPVTLVGSLDQLSLGVEVFWGSSGSVYWPRHGNTPALSGSTFTISFALDVSSNIEASTRAELYYSHLDPHHLRDSDGNRLAGFEYNLPYGTKPLPPAAAALPDPDPSNFARSAVQWEPVGGMHSVPARLGEISASKPKHATASIDLSAIAASVREELRERSRGFYVTTLVESPGERRHLLRGLEYELARGSPLLKVSIWHIYRRASTGINTIELLGEVFLPRKVNLLAEPVEICLPAPAEDAERARIAVRGRSDSDWTILDTTLTEDGQLCAETVRVSWFVIVLEPEAEEAAA